MSGDVRFIGWQARTTRLWKRGLSNHLREQLLAGGDVTLLRELEAMPDAALRRLSHLDQERKP